MREDTPGPSCHLPGDSLLPVAAWGPSSEEGRQLVELEEAGAAHSGV